MGRTFMNELWLRGKSLFNRKQLDRDLDDELAFHLAKREEANRAAGMGAQEAGYAARRRMGNVTRLKEISRELRTFASLETLCKDVCYEANTMRKSPGPTPVSALNLTLVGGANTTPF